MDSNCEEQDRPRKEYRVQMKAVAMRRGLKIGGGYQDSEAFLLCFGKRCVLGKIFSEAQSVCVCTCVHPKVTVCLN